MHNSTGDAHRPVLLDAAIQALCIRPGGIYLDGTFGRGGHARAILERLNSHGRLYALDKDPEAIAVARQIVMHDKRLQCLQGSFSDLARYAEDWGILGNVDGVLFDLGVSSPQLDNPMRGFSFLKDGPLDMRMDPKHGLSAAQWLAKVSEEQLSHVLKQYGEERFAKRIARSINHHRRNCAIQSTAQLAKIIAESVPRREPGKHPATRSFQAIRIFINRELDDLEAALQQTPQVLRAGGRLAVISFHSLEDRIAKRSIRRFAEGDPLPPDLPVTKEQTHACMRVVGRKCRASELEIENNPRARSAMLRVAERLQ